jgi:hypothetical protein
MRQGCAILVNFGFTGAAITWVIFASSLEGLDMIDHVVYALIMCIGFLLFIYLDAYQKFHKFHKFFQHCFNGHGQAVFGASLILVGFVDYVLIEIYYRVLMETGSQGLLISLYVLYYFSLLLFFITFMAF